LIIFLQNLQPLINFTNSPAFDKFHKFSSL
jgi:hypothetical protein